MVPWRVGDALIGIQASGTKCVRKLLRVSCLEHKPNDWVLSKINFFTRHNSLSQNHPSGYLGGWATPWSAEEMLDGQHQRVDIPAHDRAAL